MSINELKSLLSASADDVRQVQVHRAAIAQSKRATVRRAVIASVAVMVVAGGGIATAGQLNGNGSSGAAAGDNDVSNGTDEPTGDDIRGTFYNTTFRQGEGETLETWRPGEEKPNDITADPDGLYYHTGTVSPDGRHIAYLTGDPEYTTNPANGNQIHLYNVNANKITTVGDYSGLENTCSEPAWSPDGSRLLIDRGTDAGDERIGFVDVASGEFTPVEVPNPCDLKVATDDNGNDLLFSSAADGDRADIYVTDSNGDTEKTALGDTITDAGRYLRQLTAVSPDGRYACLSTDTSPVYGDFGDSRMNTCDLIADVATGDPIELPIPQDELATGWYGGQFSFAVADRLLILVPDDSGYDWQLFGYDGKPIGEPVETDLVISNVPAFIGFVPEIG